MARNGATVFVADILTKQAILVANDINTQFENQAKAITLDVSLEDSWLNTIKQIEDTCGQIDILVNNAGYLLAKSFEQANMDEWRTLV